MIQQRKVALQDPFLNILRKERIPVSIFLVNGIKLQGRIESFDQFVVLLRNSVSQMIYKHAISTIVPSRSVRIPFEGSESEERGNVQGNDPGNVHENDQGNDHGNDHGNEARYPDPQAADPQTADPQAAY